MMTTAPGVRHGGGEIPFQGLVGQLQELPGSLPPGTGDTSSSASPGPLAELRFECG